MAEITIRPATTNRDRTAVCDIANRAFEIDTPTLAARAMRLGSPLRATGTWWLLEEDGAPACSLVDYPLTFATPAGELVRGFGFGAVSTLPEHRGRGHASVLCRHVADLAVAEGRRAGLLFSGIPKAFYERLGFRACPAWKGVCKELRPFVESGERAALVALDPRLCADALVALHGRALAGTLHLARDAEGHALTLTFDSEDYWFGLGDPDGELRGYVRLCKEDEVLQLIELALPGESDAEPVLRAAAALGVGLGCERLDTWLGPDVAGAEWFEDVGRATSLPMVCGTDGAELGCFSPADYF